MSPLTKHRRAIAIALPFVLTVVVSVLLLAFTWPAATAEVRSLPIAMAGPAPMVEQVSESLVAEADGAIELVEVDDREAALGAIERREVYGAVLLGAEPEVLTASAASPVVSQLLGGVADQLQAGVTAQAAAAQAAGAATGGAPGASAPTVVVTEVAPLADGDPRGALIGAASFPLVLAAIIGGALAALLVQGALRRFAVVAAFSLLVGFAVASILQGWFGALQGTFAVNALALGMLVAAGTLTIVGLEGLLGKVGIPLGAITLMLVANPIASAAQPLEFLPEPWGEVGQFFPPGAGATLVRNLSYFPDANIAESWLVLGAWAVGGALLLGVGRLARRPVVRRSTALA
jgi:hypothetical protein